MFIEYLLWLCLMMVLYVYFGYPLLLIILSRFKKASAIVGIKDYPSVSIIIAAFNEEKVIQEKINNCLALDYPKNKLHIIVASDGSSDSTNEIVGKLTSSRVQLVAHEVNKGKSSIQNQAVKVAKGDILLFSDADTFLRADALKRMCEQLNQTNVGCVIGKIVFQIEGEGSVGEGEGLYWRYELSIRAMESRIGNFAMGTGAIMAVRKILYQPLNENVGDDFVLPLQVVLQGQKVIYEPRAIAEGQLYQTQAKDLFQTKVRIISKDLRGLFSCSEILNPIKHPLYAWGLLSHKLLRWLIPFFLILIFTLNIFLLRQPVYLVLFLMQLVFYCAATLGYILEKQGRKNKASSLPFAFCVVNFAAFKGVIKYFSGGHSGRWEPVR